MALARESGVAVNWRYFKEYIIMHRVLFVAMVTLLHLTCSTHRCATAATTTSAFVRRCMPEDDELPINVFSGGNLELECPPPEDPVLVHNTSWFIERPSHPVSEPLQLTAGSAFSVGTVNRFLMISDVSVEHEGLYTCRLNYASGGVGNMDGVDCVFIVGRAVFTCEHGNRNLNAIEGDDITFDASIAFVEGGLRNQLLRGVTLRRTGQRSALYYCSATEEDCRYKENYSQVQIDFSVQNGNFNIGLTMMNVSLNNGGEYTVAIETVTPQTMDSIEGNQEIETISLSYNVSVSGLGTEPTAPASSSSSSPPSSSSPSSPVATSMTTDTDTATATTAGPTEAVTSSPPSAAENRAIVTEVKVLLSVAVLVVLCVLILVAAITVFKWRSYQRLKKSTSMPVSSSVVEVGYNNIDSMACVYSMSTVKDTFGRTFCDCEHGCVEVPHADCACGIETEGRGASQSGSIETEGGGPSQSGSDVGPPSDEERSGSVLNHEGIIPPLSDYYNSSVATIN